MKVIVFGAAGATGRLLLEKLPAAGHEVTAAVRSPNAPTLKGAASMRTCDSSVAPSLHESMAEQECAFFVVSPSSAVGPTTVTSDGIRNLLAGARMAGTR